MSVPVAAGYPQLADYGLIKKNYTAKVNVKFYSETILPRITDSSYEGQLKEGDEVVIPQRPTVPFRTKVKGGPVVWDSPVAPDIRFKIEKCGYYGIGYDIADIRQTHVAIRDEAVIDGVQNAQIGIETAMFAAIYSDVHTSNQGTAAGAKSASISLGSAAAPLVISTGTPGGGETDPIDALTRCAAVLHEQNALRGSGGAPFIIIPVWYWLRLLNSDLKNAFLMGDAKSALRTGLIGSIADIPVYVSNNLADTSGSGGYCNILFGVKKAVAFAAQMNNEIIEVRHPETLILGKFGIWLYDWKVVKSEGLGVLRAKPD